MTDPESLLGMQLHEFLLVNYIASGAMGLVYRAKDTKMDRFVALKVVSKKADLAPVMAEARKRLKNEAQAAGRLSHPNIVTVHGWGETDEYLYICMEYVAGRTLAEILHERKSIPAAEVLAWFDQILMALEVSAAEGIVHRDIKPSNIMVMRDNRVKVMDFGIAKLPTTHLTVTGMILGTPYYMSPEQVCGEGVDIRSDLFSLGVVLYQMLADQKPFEAEGSASLIFKILNKDPVPLREINSDIPRELEAFCLKALAKDPQQRYQTPTEMLRDLRALVLSMEKPDLESTLSLSPAAGWGVTREPPSQASFPVEKDFPEPEEPPASVPEELEIPELSRSGEAQVLPQRTGVPARRVLVASTLALIVVLGGIAGVRQWQKASQPAVTSREDAGRAAPAKTAPSTVPQAKGATSAPSAEQGGISVDQLVRRARTIVASNPADARKLLEAAISLKPDHYEAVFELAKLLDRAKELPAAIEQYENALRLNNKDPSVFFRLGSLYMRQGNYDRALQDFEACRALSPSNLDEVLRNMGIAASKQNDPFRAAGLFKEALAANPKNDAALRSFNESILALMSQAKEQSSSNPDNAGKILAQVLSLDPMRYEASIELARLLDRTKDYAAAIGQYENALRLNNTDPQAYFRLASLYLGQGKYDEALKNFEACSALSPPNKDEVLVNMGVACLKKNNPAQAVDYFKEASDLNPRNEAAARFLKESLGALAVDAKEQAKTDPEKAQKMLEKVLVLDPNRYEASAQLAAILDGKKDYPEAIKQYENVLRQNKNDAGAYFKLASLYLAQGNYDQALKNFASCKALSPPNKDEVLVNMGVAYSKKNDYGQAVDCFKEASDLNPKNEAAGRLLKESMGVLVSAAGEQAKTDPDRAQKMLEKVLSIDPNRYEASVKLAGLYERKKDYASAIAQYQNALRLNNRDAESAFKLGSIYLTQGKLDQALQTFESCKALSPPNKDEVLLSMGIAWSKKNDWGRALDCYEEALAQNPRNEAVGRLLKEAEGSLVSQARETFETNPADAQKMLEKVMSVDPDQADASLDLARLLDRKGDLQGAASHYLNTLRINNKCAEAYFRLGAIYMAEGDYDRALVNFESCKVLSPDNLDEVLMNMGIAHAKKNDIPGAQAYFKEAVDLNKKNDRARKLLSDSIDQMVSEVKDQLQTNPDEAGKTLERAISLNPDHFEAHFQRARLLTFKNDYSAAIAEYQKALSLNKNSADAYFNLGYIYLMQGNYDLAIKSYEACRKFSPSYQDEVLTNLGISYYQKNDNQQAQRLFKEAIKINPNNESAAMYLKSLEG